MHSRSYGSIFKSRISEKKNIYVGYFDVLLVLIDTFDSPTIFDTTGFMSKTYFYPVYIGPMKDSITLSYYISSLVLNERKKFIEEIDSTSLKVFVDTSKIVNLCVPCGQIISS